MLGQVNPQDPAHLTALRDRISAERLGPYLNKVGHDLSTALQLYDWNITAAAALSADLDRLEVSLRNTMHDQLTQWHKACGGTGFWFDRPRLLDARGRQDVATARRRLREKETAGRIVAELSFGFWRYLLAKQYHDSLWFPALRKAFPHMTRPHRPTVEQQVIDLHMLRNRIAHREPVFRRELATDQHNILTIAGYICPHARAWIKRRSMVPQVLTQQPGHPPRL